LLPTNKDIRIIQAGGLREPREISKFFWDTFKYKRLQWKNTEIRYFLIHFAVVDLECHLMLTSRDSFVAKRRKKGASGVWCLGKDYLPYSTCNCPSLVWKNREEYGQRIRWYEIRKRYLLPLFLSNVIAFPTHITLCSSFFPFLVTSWF